jgi:hypothetical protein
LAQKLSLFLKWLAAPGTFLLFQGTCHDDAQQERIRGPSRTAASGVNKAASARQVAVVGTSFIAQLRRRRGKADVVEIDRKSRREGLRRDLQAGWPHAGRGHDLPKAAELTDRSRNGDLATVHAKNSKSIPV